MEHVGTQKKAIFQAGDTFSTISFGINFCGGPFNHPTSQENIHNSTRLSMEVSNQFVIGIFHLFEGLTTYLTGVRTSISYAPAGHPSRF